MRHCDRRSARGPVRGLLTVTFLLGIACSSSPPAAVNQDLETLGWLVGCWQMAAGGTVVDEHWMAPSGNAMLGMSRTVKDGRLVGYELMLLVNTDLGLVYRAHPSGQAMANFHATESGRRGVVFENPSHDFPRRIAYWPVGADGLKARVDDGTDRRSYELEYKRTACPGTGGS
jgi:hypothetical protein